MKQSRHFRHYFFDLVVVFVGISLAFMLDNWSGNRQDHRMLDEYYESLSIDIETDIQTLDTCVLNLEKRVNSYSQILGFIKNKSSSDMIIDQLDWVLGTEQFYSNKSTYESLINSGNMNLISEVRSKKELYRVYGLYNNVEFLDEVNYNYYFNTILPLIHQYTNMITFEGIEDFVSSNEFSSIVVVGRGFLQTQLKSYMQLRDGLAGLQDIILQEMN